MNEAVVSDMASMRKYRTGKKRTPGRRKMDSLVLGRL
jgi:hypothetical protein